MNWVRSWSVLSAVCCGCALTLSCGEGPPAATKSRPPLVEAVQARSGTVPLQHSAYGVVRAENQVEVRTEIAARVADVLVSSGANVERGQLLVRLEDDEPKEQLRRAEADVRLAEAEATEAEARLAELTARAARVRRLAAQELVSEQELETLESQLDGARASTQAAGARVQQSQAAVEERRSLLERTRIVAPVSGRIGEQRAEIGMRVDPGTTLFRLGNLDRVTIDVTLSESMSAVIEAGQRALVELPDGRDGTRSEIIEGKIARISPFLDARSFTTQAEIELANAAGKLRPGMFVDVTLLYGTSDEATLVPMSALWENPRSGDRGIFVVDDTDAIDDPERERQISWASVSVLAEGAGIVGVDRLAADAWVVVTGQHLLHRAMSDGESAVGETPGVVTGRIRPASWERIASLQSLQRDDLLAGFLDKQRRLAEALGAEIPADEGEVQRVLAAAAGD